MASFSEKQRVPKSVFAFLAIFWFLMSVYFTPGSTSDRPIPSSLAPLVIALLVMTGFVSLLRLDTRFDSEGIHYRLFPFRGWRTILWADVQQATIITYPLGYGLRHVDAVYNSATRFTGNDGLRIQKTDGKTVLIGTQRPDELQLFLGSLPIEIRA